MRRTGKKGRLQAALADIEKLKSGSSWDAECWELERSIHRARAAKDDCDVRLYSKMIP